jgi:hypothetical protein
MKHSRVLVTMVLGLGFALALLWMLCGGGSPAVARSGLVLVSSSLTRQHAPVVISGSFLPNLQGRPLEEIFVYAYEGTISTQIPFQIDERDAGGMYVAVEDGQLDDNDELVFMAMDAGAWADSPSLDVGGTAITPTYVITLTDPVSDTRAWAYAFCSDALARTFATDYVSYDSGDDRITSPGRYVIGFNATYAFQDYLTLGSSSLDLLDRHKLRAAGTVLGFPVSADEQDFTKDGVHAIDGPVRVTRVSTSTFDVLGEATEITANLFAYRGLVVHPATTIVPGDPFEISYYRASIDWNEQASGMTFYDANNPAGVTIDGITDTITISPPTRWTQIAGVTGTVVNVSHIPAGLGGTQSTYYKDDSVVDSGDTSDQRSYGDAGLQVNDPNPGVYTILGHVYFLTGAVTNVGAVYVDYYDNPLQVSIAGPPAAAPTWWYVYFPLVMKD